MCLCSWLMASMHSSMTEVDPGSPGQNREGGEDSEKVQKNKEGFLIIPQLWCHLKRTGTEEANQRENLVRNCPSGK